ncbi:MAG TPA: hypothetical protein VGX70_19665, partial [Gemmataceae bacterium]|nr:hypothetical protein [Gemmataceae bacterium]
GSAQTKYNGKIGGPLRLGCQSLRIYCRMDFARRRGAHIWTPQILQKSKICAGPVKERVVQFQCD